MKKEWAYAVLIVFLLIGALVYTNNKDKINFFKGLGEKANAPRFNFPNFLIFMGIVLLVIAVILFVVSLFSNRY